MTLDVTIGKITIERIEEEDDLCFKPLFHVQQCPEAKEDINDKEYTLWTKESYRSGSTDFWSFFKRQHPLLKEIYFGMREHPDSNDFDVAYVKPYLEKINSIKIEDFKDPNEVNDDRLKWLRYWCNKAVELYGEEAGISFG